MHTATLEEIRAGKVTDVYFVRAKEAIEKAGFDKHVAAELTASSLPGGYEWAIFAGVEEAVEALQGLDCDVDALPEGAVFYPGEPVMRLRGMYTSFGIYETALLGFLCQASGVATKAARCRLAARDKPLISFGARRMHPAIGPMVERNAYVGGCDGFAVVKTSDLVGVPASGTMPHSLILLAGEMPAALRAFDETAEEGVPRVALIDTFDDEKFAAIEAAETLGDRLAAVRLDTPGSRKGDFEQLLREVRWELDLRGYQHVKLFVSGGLDEEQMRHLNPVVDGYGVGTAISNAPVINFAMDIVEIEGRPMTKRGKLSGAKQPMRCDEGHHWIAPEAAGSACPECGASGSTEMAPLTRAGRLVADLPSAQAIRDRVLATLSRLG